MNETLKTKSGWRMARRILITLAVLATLVATFYTEEDWRGKRAWENYRHEWEAKGEKFDWHAFVPPAVPDDQNFFTAPVFANMRNGKIAMNIYGTDGNPNGGVDGYWPKMTLTDLNAWQNFYRNPTNASVSKAFVIAPQPQTPATDVLLALSKLDPAIEELRQASQRPDANVPIHYEEGLSASASTLLPYLAELKRCSQVFRLRIIAELADGQSAKALDDEKLFLRLNDSIRNSPFLISHLVRMAIMSLALQPVYEGLARHEWSDEQLAVLDAELSKMNYLADYEFAMRGDRAFAIAEIENQRRTRELISPKLDAKGQYVGLTTNKWFTLLPSAFFYQNKLAIARMQQQWILPLVDTNSRIVSPEKWRQANDTNRMEMKHYSYYKVQALMLFTALTGSISRTAFAQSSVDLARVACALERYRLAHNEYPKSFDTLTPQFIAQVPHDLINGQPLHYRLKPNGQFVLYSVGWNETDDGGKIVLTKGGSVDRDKGDWVWQYPIK